MSDDEASDDHSRDKSRDDHGRDKSRDDQPSAAATPPAAEAAAECSGGIEIQQLERSPSVIRKFRALGFGAHKKASNSKEPGKKKKSSWTSKLNSRHKHINSDVSETSVSCSSCICTGYKKTDDSLLEYTSEKASTSSKASDIVTLDDFHSVFATVTAPSAHRQSNSEASLYSVDDWDEVARRERAKEIEEGIDPPPGFHVQVPQNNSNVVPLQVSDLTMALSQLTVAPYPYLERLTEAAAFPQAFLRFFEWQLEGFPGLSSAHSQIDYVHCLVPDLLEITNCSFYWGKMDRHEAEKLLDKRQEGTFLLRDSAQEEYLFSVSFRRYDRTLHARIEQWNHKFSFDSHDPGVFASNTVCGLIEHYKDPSFCMFFEPMLTLPLNRSFVFPLQHLCRSVICNRLTYDGINSVNLPKKLKFYLKEYHYKQRVRVRRFDVDQ